MTLSKLRYQIFFKASTELGEGLHWDGYREILWFVDIKKYHLLSLKLETKEFKSYKFKDFLGWAITSSDNSLILGLKDNVMKFDPETNNLTTLHTKIFKSKKLRLNDAKATKSGKIFAGSMHIDDPTIPSGSLLCIESDKISIIDEGYNIANGPIILSDSSMLHTDSLKKVIYLLELDKKNEVLKKHIWKSFDNATGSPDGMCIDKDKNIWIAFWGEGAVRKFSFQGVFLDEVIFPDKFVTNVCFGGKNLDRLFVTSAKNSDENNQNNLNDGNLYEILGHQTSGNKIYSAKI